MKIPLTIKGGEIIATASVRAPHIYGIIEFIVDTGSTRTFISEGHALQLQIPVRRLRFLETSYGVGGGVFNLYELPDVTLSFKTENDKVEQFKLGHIAVAETTVKKDERARRISLAALSILGTDFIINNNLKLCFDPKNNVAYLEK